MTNPASPRAGEAEALRLLRGYGAEAFSFKGLPLLHWSDAPPPLGTGAFVFHADTGTAWVAAGLPIGPPSLRASAALRFVQAARAAGRRACFFAAESRLPGLDSLPIGEQPIFAPREWLSSGARSRGIREQLRRSRRKGVLVRRASPDELRWNTPLRDQVERVAAEHSAMRRMEPMGFLVSQDPFMLPDHHRYYVAERGGGVVAFLSAVPVYARHGWLVEDVLRSRDAPNGTAEQLLVALAREAPSEAVFTLGLAPLSGQAPWWLIGARILAQPLYDFDGIRAFRERLHPTSWEPVWLEFLEGESAAVHLRDALVAFAGGSLLGFALRTLLHRPGGLPWLLALVLGAWTVVLAALVAVGRPATLGLDRIDLGGWVIFDALFALLLFRLARRPRALHLALASGIALADAAAYTAHLGASAHAIATWFAGLRGVALVGPVVAAVLLGWAALLSAAPRLRTRTGRRTQAPRVKDRSRPSIAS